jgi:hypothetical protein
MADLQIDKVMVDLKRRMLKKIAEDELALASDEHTNEDTVAASEDLAVSSIDVMLPEERRMIRELLGVFPEGRETKVAKLLSALHVVGAIGNRFRWVLWLGSSSKFRIFLGQSKTAASRLAADGFCCSTMQNHEGVSPFLIGNGAAYPALGKSNRSPSRRVWVRAIQLSDIRA